MTAPDPRAARRADWMAGGGFGLMVHWIAPGPVETGRSAADLNRAVDAFDLAGFLRDFEATRARWLIFTVGQNTGCYASPNATLDRLAGKGHCSRRDLVAEIADGVRGLGARFVAYLPGEVQAPPLSLRKALGWTEEPETAQAEFQKRYLEVIAEWAVRWGSRVDGWWIDGCYDWPIFRNTRYDWPAWYRALRAGNPRAALAFNDGCCCVGRPFPLRPEHDYLSGEAEQVLDGRLRLGRNADAKEISLHAPEQGIFPGTDCRWHALLPIDAFWTHRGQVPPFFEDWRYARTESLAADRMEPPIYSDDELLALLENAHRIEGGVTFNAGIFQSGRLGAETREQLGRVAGRLPGPFVSA